MKTLAPVTAVILAYGLTAWGAGDPATTATPQPAPETVSITVDVKAVKRQMAGGFGASWHAIRKETPEKGRGSAWGANPPLQNLRAWEQIERHASWLGLDFVRVELDQRMYEPERGRFDWNNEEMKTLCRILDWCQKNHADVFLQQMWSDVAWNALDGVAPFRSAPKSLEDFAVGFRTLVDYLVNQKKYTCIRWLCINNEPGEHFSWWQDKNGPRAISDGLRAVRNELDVHGIKLPLSGPDWVRNPLIKLEPARIDFDQAIGAYDIHGYAGLSKQTQGLLKEWAEWAHQRNKPFFLTEFGNMSLGWQDSNPGPRSYPAVISNVEVILRGLAVNVDGFNRWSFLNRGDIDGQWQLVRTWDMQKKTYLAEAVPEPVPYNGYGLITRFAAKHSAILGCEVKGGHERILAGALRSPKGNLTVWLLNQAASPQTVELTLANQQQAVTVYPYQVTEAALSEAGFALSPGKAVSLSGQAATVDLPAQSVTALTTFHLEPEAPGIVLDGALAQSVSTMPSGQENGSFASNSVFFPTFRYRGEVLSPESLR